MLRCHRPVLFGSFIDKILASYLTIPLKDTTELTYQIKISQLLTHRKESPVLHLVTSLYLVLQGSPVSPIPQWVLNLQVLAWALTVRVWRVCVHPLISSASSGETCTWHPTCWQPNFVPTFSGPMKEQAGGTAWAHTWSDPYSQQDMEQMTSANLHFSQMLNRNDTWLQTW